MIVPSARNRIKRFQWVIDAVGGDLQSAPHTYVDRSAHRFEETVREALDIPKLIVSISGPSKSGKTVLVKKVVEQDHLIPVSGASIRTADDLWRKVLAWMEAPSERTETTQRSFGGSANLSGGGEVGLPLVAKGKAEISVDMTGQSGTGVSQKIAADMLQPVVDEIAESSFVVFVDDFHYIPRDVQQEIGRQIKEAAEFGVRLCTASVPHRADDVVRSNTELRGRVRAIDITYWSEAELAQIAAAGFDALNMDVAPSITTKLSAEAFGSPQLMQTICLNLCFETKKLETLPQKEKVEVNDFTLGQVFERTSTFMDFVSLVEALHAGPKQRGLERKQFDFVDNSKGDVYRAVLLAITSAPPKLAFNYDDMLRRVRAVCRGDSPVGSSISQALVQMHTIADTIQPSAKVIEWDENVLDIVDPYFLFFLRSSPTLRDLARRPH